jgi:hypothetical protein
VQRRSLPRFCASRGSQRLASAVANPVLPLVNKATVGAISREHPARIRDTHATLTRAAHGERSHIPKAEAALLVAAERGEPGEAVLRSRGKLAAKMRDSTSGQSVPAEWILTMRSSLVW